MTHYRMRDREPSVMITSNRNELKIYQGNIVYLNNGDNFELRFFNPLPEKIGVEIIFNGIKKGDSYLVLNPGQDLILDRFLDEQRKMVFETYTIDGNNEEAVKAIEKNGLINFNFYKERNSYSGYYRNCQDTININYKFPPKNQNYRTKGNTITTTSAGPYYYSGLQGTLGVAGSAGSAGTKGLKHFGATSRGVTTNTSFTTSTSSVTSTSSTYCSNTSSFDYIPTMDLNELETGRVEKGSYSDQDLRRVNVQFADMPYASLSYQILPYSVMNREINEVREYCPSCRYRIRKQTWHYCPKCGEEL